MEVKARALSVSELNEYVRRLLAGDPILRSVEVSGEISGYKHHISGHRYFSLKDAGARVQCVMFRQNAMGLNFQPQDGMRVTVRASASIFARDGSYQLYVSEMSKLGIGELYLRFEQLKEKLAREGLFDPSIKKELPLLPSCIGVATSQTGAAVRDIVRVARRRDPNVGILLAPCSVQGAEAVDEIVRAIERLNADGRAEVILVGRGGGSIEDLWAFNEEKVARAIAASVIPVISCVGHETDFTIADFVADVRAATPSMAAEIAVPEAAKLRRNLEDGLRRIAAGLNNAQKLRRERLAHTCAAAALLEPTRVLIDNRRTSLAELMRGCDDAMAAYRLNLRTRLERCAAQIGALNPNGVLERGYAYIRGEDGIMTSVQAFKKGETVHIFMRDGKASAEIKRVTAVEEKRNEKEIEI